MIIKKTFSSTALALIFSAVLFTAPATVMADTPVRLDAPVLSSIQIATPADKLAYIVNEPLDITGLTVLGTYIGVRGFVPVAITSSNVIGFDSSVATSSQILTVTAGGMTTTYTIAVNAAPVPPAPVLSSIQIATPADKLAYIVNEPLDITGLTVLGTYIGVRGFVPVAITSSNVIGFDSSVATSSQILTVTAGGMTTPYTITVNAVPVVLQSIAIGTAATKLTYTVGESLDITGLVIIGTYSDTSTSTMTVVAGDVTGFNSSTPVVGQVLTITLSGKTTTYVITVNAVPAPTPAPTAAPASGGNGGGGGGMVTPPPSRMQTVYPDGRIVYADTLGGSGASTTTPTRGEVLGASTFRFTLSLRLGSRGEEVKELQKRLIAEGLLSSEVTGYFGKLTKAAVMKFQEKNGLEQVGNVGPKTRAKLNAGVAVGTGSGNTIPGCAVGYKFNTTTGQACPVQ